MNNKSFLLFSIISTILLVVLREFFISEFTGILEVACIAFFMIFLNYKNCLSYLFLVLPMTCGIPGYSMLVSYIILLFKTRKISLWQYIPPLLIIVSELINFALYDFESSVIPIFSFISFVSVFFYLLFVNDERIDVRQCILNFCIGALFASLVVCVKLFIGSDIETVLSASMRGGVGDSENNIGQFDLNANSMAFFAITVFSIILIGREKLKLSYKVSLILLLFSIVIGVLTFSRSWLVCFVLTLILFLISQKKDVKLITSLCAIVLVAFLLTPQLVKFLQLSFINRFAEVNVYTAGERTIITGDYINKILENTKYWLCGTGATYYKAVLGLERSVHSGLLQIVVCTGLLGVVIFTTSFIHYFKYYKLKENTFLFIIPFIVCLIFNQTIQFFNPYFLMFPFLPTLYLLRLK